MNNKDMYFVEFIHQSKWVRRINPRSFFQAERLPRELLLTAEGKVMGTLYLRCDALLCSHRGTRGTRALALAAAR